MNAEFLPIDFPKRQSGPLALAHVTVLPMDTDRALHDQTLVLNNGTIRALGPANAVDTAGMRIVDGRGNYVMPGLADMYTHYWDPADSPLYLASGITTVRTVCVPFQLAMSRLAERGDFPSPRIVTLCPPIDGIGPDGRTDMPRGVALTDPAQADALVERFARAGYDQIKAFSLLTEDNLRALCRSANKGDMRVSANCPNTMTFEEASDVGVYCLDQLHNIARGHLRNNVPEPRFWDRFDPVPGTQLDFAAIRRLARILADQQVWNVPTLVFHQRIALTPAQAANDPALEHVSPTSIKDWESTLVRWTYRARMDHVNQWRAFARERAGAFSEVVAIFRDEGVALLAGTDSLNPWNVQGASLHQELANFVAAGMSNYEALRAATTEAARFLGEHDKAGTIAVGKRADLTVLRSNPLRDVGALRDIEAVSVNGYYLARADLRSMLEQRAVRLAVPPELPGVQLPAAKSYRAILSEGVWIERIVGAVSGRLAYRHSRMVDGGWSIEERHACSVPRRHMERRDVQLVLDQDFNLRSCEYRIDTFAGSAVGTVTRSADRYELQYTDIDGSASKRAIEGEAMLPSERMSLTLWPLLLASLPREGSTMIALDADEDSLVERNIDFAAKGDLDWQLVTRRSTHTTEQVYRFAHDGRFLGMRETMPLLWLRELEPLS